MQRLPLAAGYMASFPCSILLVYAAQPFSSAISHLMVTSVKGVIEAVDLDSQNVHQCVLGHGETQDKGLEANNG